MYPDGALTPRNLLVLLRLVLLLRVRSHLTSRNPGMRMAPRDGVAGGLRSRRMCTKMLCFFGKPVLRTSAPPSTIPALPLCRAERAIKSEIERPGFYPEGYHAQGWGLVVSRLDWRDWVLFESRMCFHVLKYT